MDTALWIVQAILAVKLLTAALSHVLGHSRPAMRLALQKSGKSARPLLSAAGLLMLAGALGLILPGLLGAVEKVTVGVAAALAILLLGSIPMHIRCRETPKVFVSVILVALAIFVAYERWTG